MLINKITKNNTLASGLLLIRSNIKIRHYSSDRDEWMGVEKYLSKYCIRHKTMFCYECFYNQVNCEIAVSNLECQELPCKGLYCTEFLKHCAIRELRGDENIINGYSFTKCRDFLEYYNSEKFRKENIKYK